MIKFAPNPNSITWLDGEFIPTSEAKCDIFSHGLHYASSVFEGIRCYDCEIFKAKEHYERFIQSGKTLDVPIKYTSKQLTNITQELLKLNNLTNAYIRPIAWRGSEYLGVTSLPCKGHLAIGVWDIQPLAEMTSSTGLKLCLADWVRPDPKSAPVHAKAAGLYVTSTISLNKAKQDGYDNALMLDWRGYVAECTGANIFFIINGEVHTSIADCLLNGITRQTVIQLAHNMGYVVKERYIKYEEIGTADEVFITGTAAEIMAVKQIEQHKYKLGPITKKLREAFQNLRSMNN